MRTAVLISTTLIAAAVLVAVLLNWHGLGPAPRAAQPAPPAKTTEIPSLNTGPAKTSRPQNAVEVNDAKTDWKALFASSHDYSAFVKHAANAASDGDGSAALYVAEAVLKCALEVSMYQARHSGDSSMHVGDDAWRSRYPVAARRMSSQYKRHYALCKGFFHHDAFAALPPRKGGYFSYSYWMHQAYKDHNPLAEVQHVAAVLPAPVNPRSPFDSQQYAAARRTLIRAVSSGTPAAVFRTGMLLTRGSRTDVIRGIAIALAGCRLGYDCGSSNAVIFGDCARTGHCPPGEDFSDVVTQSIGEAGYARAYALAQQLAFAISHGDTATVSRFVRIPPSYRCSPPDKRPVHCAPLPDPPGNAAR